MKISTKGRYALRLMVDIALNETGKYITLKEVSIRQVISIKYLEQIVTPLVRAGLLKSTRGAQGGYRLAKKTHEYTVAQILTVIEGSFAPIACLESAPNECSRYGECATIEFWEGLYDLVKDYMESVTLENLVEKQRNKVEGQYYI